MVEYNSVIFMKDEPRCPEASAAVMVRAQLGSESRAVPVKFQYQDEAKSSCLGPPLHQNHLGRV